MGCDVKLKKGASILITFVAAIALAAFVQQQDSGAPQFPPLKVEVSLISLTATVVDKSDKAITGLGKNDFEVYEDGVRQGIERNGRTGRRGIRRCRRADEHPPRGVRVLAGRLTARRRPRTPHDHPEDDHEHQADRDRSEAALAPDRLERCGESGLGHSAAAFG